MVKIKMLVKKIQIGKQKLVMVVFLVLNIDIGIKEGDCKKIVDGLVVFQVDVFMFYLKIYNFYWNVIGLMFNLLYIMFEIQYIEQWVVLDDVVECICVLGFNVFGFYCEFVVLILIVEELGLIDSVDWCEMVCQLVVVNEVVCCIVCKVFDVVVDVDDVLIEDLMIQCLQIYEKYVWMLCFLLQ